MHSSDYSSWDEIQREIPVDPREVAVYAEIVELQQELARQLRRRGMSEDRLTEVLEAASPELEQLVRGGVEVDVGPLVDRLLLSGG